MTNLNHKTAKKSLSRREIEALRTSGAVSPELDDFEREALEGFQKTQVSTKIMKQLDKKFLRNYSFLTGSIIAFTAVLALSLFFYLRAENKKVLHTRPLAKNKTIEVTDYQLPKNISDLKPITEKKIIHAQEIKDHFQSKKIENTESKPVANEEPSPVNLLPKKSLDDQTIQKIDLPEVISHSFVAKEIYVEDLKLVDYRAYRTKPAVKTEQIIITGTSADSEIKTNGKDQLEREKIEIPYYDYIKKTTGIFADGNFKKALYRYEEILGTYPDDLNANFYGGLCYFNLGKIDKAKACFYLCSKHNYLNFNEEAEWYLAKCFLAEGNKEQAGVLLNKIVSSGGFYAEAANKLVKSL